MTSEKTYLSQSVDYLGFLEAKLRDLRGIATLVHELLQNADDVHDEDGKPAATRITFDVCDDALIVENDGVFRQVDFDRMQRIASGGKREEEGTTGAFGIGFISVYQITDHPEVYSSGRHWTLRPEVPEAERIEQEELQTTATRFRLPWAFDPHSQVRQKLRIEAVQRESIDHSAFEMAQALSGAALFLKQLSILELKRSGVLIRRIQRDVDDEGTIQIQDGHRTQTWRILRGSFAREAEKLRATFSQIEAKRHSDVSVAVPDDPSQVGRLYAVLPTQSQIPVPLYINADFFPSSDRKRILLENGYQTEWNRCALRAASQTLGEHLDELRTILGHTAFWNLIKRLDDAKRQADRNECDQVFDQFWRDIEWRLPQIPIVYTSDDRWLRPAEVRLLESTIEQEAEPIFRALGIATAHPALRPHFGLMRQRAIGTPLLSIPDIVAGLKSVRLDRLTPTRAAPPVLHSLDHVRILWTALDAVWARQSEAEREAQKQSLAECAIALDTDNALQPPVELYRADEDAREIFPFYWLRPDLPADRMPGMLVEEFDASAAVTFLEEEAGDLSEQWKAGEWHPAKTYRWLEGRREEFERSSELIRRLRAVPIWPAADDLRPLTGLYIPGGFEDPLKLTVLVDLDALGGRKEFLQDLGVKPLTFETYLRHQVPKVFRDTPDLPAESRRGLVQLLTRKLGEIRDDEELRRMLGGLPLIECTDGAFRAAHLTYAHSNVAVFLVDRIHIAAPVAQEAEALKALYSWLGVAQEPRPEDVLARLRQLPAVPDVPSRQLVQSVFEYLISQWPRWDAERKQKYAALKEMNWLPGSSVQSGTVGARWYKPGLVHAVFQDYLYKTQAIFLDLPRQIQNQAATVKLIEFLGINDKPNVIQVVNHLKKCSQEGVEVHPEVYRYLSENADSKIVVELKDISCLYLPGHGYLRPYQVFWREHDLGRYRYQLGTQLRPYQPLFDKLGIREAPDDSDYWLVIQEISEQFGAGNHPLDNDAYYVLMHCWERLSEALATNRVSAERLSELGEIKVIPDPRRVLTPPEHMFFEDRAGLASKFSGFLDYNVIVKAKGAWPAMAAAGVRPLSQAVKVRLLEPPVKASDPFLEDRINQRRIFILRAIEAIKSGNSDVLRLDALDKLRFECADHLLINYTVEVFRQRRSSDPESVPALLLPEEDLLLSVHCDGDVPWGAIARELAVAIKPEGEVGALASGIKESLSNETIESARRALDDLGFPPLQELETPATEENSPITGIGGTTDGSEPGWEGSKADGEGEVTTAAGAVAGILGSGSESRSPAPPMPLERPAGGSGNGSSSPGTGQTEAKRPSRGRLRTYVISDEAVASSDIRRNVAEHNLTVDAAGTAAILKFESRQGRTATKMDHFNEGYDVESIDAAGELRYIEVKSLSGIWTEHDAAGLTTAQFEMGREKGEHYWLYVVERATSDDYRIYCIQDPVRRVDQHLYDDGWRKLADESYYEPALAS